MNSSVLKIAAVETPALSVNPYSQGRLQSLAIRTKGASPIPKLSHLAPVFLQNYHPDVGLCPESWLLMTPPTTVMKDWSEHRLC